MVRSLALALILIGCGSKKAAEPTTGSSGSASVAGSGSGPPTPAVDPAAAKAEIAKLGDAWKRDPKTTAPLEKLAEVARAAKAWDAAVPFIVESFATTDVAVDAAFEAAVALGEKDPATLAKLLVPLVDLKPGQRVLDWKKIQAAERKHGPALAAVYLEAAKMIDQPALRSFAFSELGRLGRTEARPLLIAALAEAPFVKKDQGGGLSDPRNFVQSRAVQALEDLGPDAAAAAAVWTHMFDQRVWDGSRYDAIETFAWIVPTATAEQKKTLLDHAVNYREHGDHLACAKAYLWLSKTAAEVDALSAAPIGTPPYDPDYRESMVGTRIALTCNGQPLCLAAQLETSSARQWDSALLDKVMYDLVRAPSPDVRGPLLEILAAARSKDWAEPLIQRLPKLVPGPCPNCASTIEALIQKHTKDSLWTYVRWESAVDAFKRRGVAGQAGEDPPSFITPIIGIRRALDAGDPTAIDKAWFAPKAFGFGIEASQLGIGGDAVAAIVGRSLGPKVDDERIIFARRGVRGNVMWDVQAIINDPGHSHVSQVIVIENGTAQVRASHWSHTIDDAAATAAVAAKKFPQPAPITDLEGDAELAAFARTVLGNRDAYVKALSARDDAFAFGNSLSDEWFGPAIAKAFGGMGATFKLHDGLHVEKVSADVGFAAANVDFKGKGGVRTLRVLLVFAKEADAWKIVMSHWSYGLPIPGAT